SSALLARPGHAKGDNSQPNTTKTGDKAMAEQTRQEQDKPDSTEQERAPLQERLTTARNDESHMLAAIIKREIEHSGRFKDKLANYADAYARTDGNISAYAAEEIIREQFRNNWGHDMKDHLDALNQREASLTEQERKKGVEHADRTLTGIREDGLRWWRAQDREARSMATHYNITEAGAKRIMKEEFKRERGQDLYDVAKTVEQENDRKRQYQGNGGPAPERQYTRSRR
ncbi:MAG: hypothetical protein AAFW66_12515, partial [Pseudomonadota bacterium]